MAFFRSICVACLACFVAPASHAQAGYPTRTISIVVPFTPAPART